MKWIFVGYCILAVGSYIAGEIFLASRGQSALPLSYKAWDKIKHRFNKAPRDGMQTDDKGR